MSTELSGHNQEVNCLDSKDGLIISGSRDQTTRVRTPLQVSFTILQNKKMLHFISDSIHHHTSMFQQYTSCTYHSMDTL